jgi:hypothetical protein
MKRMVTIALAAVLALSLVGVAVGAERSKQEPEQTKRFEQVQAALDAAQAQPFAPRLATQQGNHLIGNHDEIGRATLRFWGRDRYETAVAVSEFWWDYDNTIVVYLATGRDFPDALAAGPSTFFLGPLLLVDRDRLPEPTRRELEVLRPCVIIAVGGPGVIRDAVLEEADGYTEEC